MALSRWREREGTRAAGRVRVDERPNIANARHLRRERATEVEKRLWQALRNRQVAQAKFRRQYTLGNDILDFVCLEHGLVIELDGGQHAKPETALRDEVRSEWLKGRGLRVLRFWNNDVSDNLEGVLSAIAGALAEPPSPQTPLPRAGEGLMEK
jgi:very-short-patch-repair endonuclease